MTRMNAIQAAAYFGVTERTIWNWLKAGRVGKETAYGGTFVLIPDGFVPPRKGRPLTVADRRVA